MRLIINASTLYGTGVSQVAISFIEECINHRDNAYLVFLSEVVASSMDFNIFPSNFSFHVFKGKLYNPFHWNNIKKMKSLADEFKADCMFSVFGPSWWSPTVPHLQGYAFPHYVNPDSPIWGMMSYKERLKRSVFRLIHKRALLSAGKYFVCETSEVSNRLSKFLNIPPTNIFTVSNTANAFFRNFKEDQSERNDSKEYRFFSMCSPYLHKNLGILNQVIPILDEYKAETVFYVTLRAEDFNNLFHPEVRHRIRNVGVLKPQECPVLANKCDALFLPTLLECFSASYPEAMFLKKPIITSDLSFARNICGDAALYFNPLNPNDIANTIIKLINNKQLQLDLIDEGQKRIKDFYTPSQRAQSYLDICKSLVESQTK